MPKIASVIVYGVYYSNTDGRELYRPRLRTELDRFLWQWLKNIGEQKFSPDVYEGCEDDAEDDFSDINPAEIRAALESGEESAFVKQVIADVERIAAEENKVES